MSFSFISLLSVLARIGFELCIKDAFQGDYTLSKKLSGNHHVVKHSRGTQMQAGIPNSTMFGKRSSTYPRIRKIFMEKHCKCMASYTNVITPCACMRSRGRVIVFICCLSSTQKLPDLDI